MDWDDWIVSVVVFGLPAAVVFAAITIKALVALDIIDVPD